MADADWWRGAVIYEVYPRSFQDSDGDGIGDLAGIARRLRHVADLGADAVWIAPFFRSPMKDFGYDVSDYRDVDPLFGSLADFDALIGEAHGLGLKVIIDQVLSHTSSRHPWFVESRSSRENARADWYVWAEPQADGTAPNNWLSVFGGPAWEWDTRRSQYYMHNFLTEQPDLNFHNVAVQDAVLDDMRFWLERGVDGFRLDAVNFFFHSRDLQSNPPASARSATSTPNVNPYEFQDHIHDRTQPENIAFLGRIRALLDRYAGTVSIGEVGDGPRSLATMAAYTSGGRRLHMCYTFDFLSRTFTAPYFIERIGAIEAIIADGWPCWSFSNHDVERHASRWAKALGIAPERVARLAIGILIALRGSVCLYQGEELGLTEASLRFEELVDPYGIRFWPDFKGRDGCRTPMVWEAAAPHAGFSSGRPWLPIPAEHLERAADRQRGVAASVLEHYRRMLAFRRGHPALACGSLALVDAPDDVLAFVREHGGEKVLCAFNLSDAARTLEVPSGMAVTPLSGHDFGGSFSRGRVALAAGDAFFGAIS